MSESTKKSFFKDPQNIIAIGVTLISACALFVSIMQTRIMQEERELMREFSQASVWPRLDFGISKGHKEDGSLNGFRFVLSNRGVGPAIITDVRVTYDGQAASDWWDLFEIMEIPDSISRGVNNRTFSNGIIRIGEDTAVLELDQNLPLANAFYERIEKLAFEIYYKSIYGKQWKLELGVEDNEHIELESFEGIPDDERFQS